MPEEFAYARKASGLVRGLSMMDAFAVGFMNQGLTPSIWVTVSLGLGVFLGGNLIIAAIISAVLAGIGFPLVWGILGGSMPRSGGEYIYNSRVIHPIFGIAQSFGDAAIWLIWLYVLAPLAVDPGLTITFQYLGWTGAADWLVSSAWVTFFIASIFNVIGFLFVVFGIKIFALTQKIVMFFGIGGCIIIGLVLTWSSKANFVAKWDSRSRGRQRARLPGLHQAGRQGRRPGDADDVELGRHLRRHGRHVVALRLRLLDLVHRWRGQAPRQDHHLGQPVLDPRAVRVHALDRDRAATRPVGYTFLNASAWFDNNGPTIAGMDNMPYGTNFVDLAVYTIGTASAWTKFLAFMMGSSYVAFTLWWLALSYLAFPRILFAWGMDRMGPKWFTDINPRFASPVKNHILCLVLGEALLVVYYAWLTNQMQNIVVTGMQITSVFIPTAIAALLFPYMKRCKGVWDTSPYNKWNFLGLPVVVWGALVDLVYLVILLYYFIVNNAATATFTTPSIILFVGVWVLGVGWYYIWKQRSKSVGVDVSVTYGELPPE